MKILFFIDSLCAGGKERRLTELMKGLRLNPEINFEIVIMDKEVHYQQVYNLNINIHFLLRKTKKDLSVFYKFYKICKNYKPDIVHCWDSMTAIISAPACKLLNIKFINGMVVDTPVRQNIFNKIWFRSKLTFPLSDKIIGNSKAGLCAYGAPQNKSFCIYNGMDLNRFENLKDPKEIYNEIFGINNNNIFIVGMVAAFEPRKDHKTFIKGAFSLIESNESIRFVLVGDGSDFITIKNSIPAKYFDKFFFLGKRSDVESVVNIFNVGVLLTNSKVHGEGISNSIIEYMALGKPVIATQGGGTNEAVMDSRNGYLINSHDSDQLVQSIQKLMNEKKLAEKMGAESYDKARNLFDLKIMTENYIQMYQKVLQENKN